MKCEVMSMSSWEAETRKRQKKASAEVRGDNARKSKKYKKKMRVRKLGEVRGSR